METIYSLVTKSINQNVGIIRISGPETFSIVSKLIPEFKSEANKILFTKLYIHGKFIDEMLVLIFKRPNSFTGEDIVELQPHGNIFIIEKILIEIEKLGAKQSEPGEFMKQAYMNNKIDLVQSEAINTLILSEDRKLSERAALNVSGVQSVIINEAIKNFSEIISRIQVSIDYPENQDLPKYSLKEIAKNLNEYKIKLEDIIIKSKSVIKLSKGVKIAIIGKSNAGKSSLLNALVKEDRAIVSHIQGTTRDVVESSIYLNEIKVTFQDTAGLRETDDQIEIEGIKRTFKTLEKADIIISIEEPSNRMNFLELKKYSNKLIKVMNKSDISKIAENGYVFVSALNNDLENLLNELNKFISTKLVETIETDNAVLITANQVNKFDEIVLNISRAIELINNNYQADVVALEIEEAIKKLGLIIGTKIDQDYLTNLFASFCIGK